MYVQGYSLPQYLYSKRLGTAKISINGDWFKKKWHIHTKEYSETVKRNGKDFYILLWSDWQNIECHKKKCQVTIVYIKDFLLCKKRLGYGMHSSTMTLSHPCLLVLMSLCNSLEFWWEPWLVCNNRIWQRWWVLISIIILFFFALFLLCWDSSYFLDYTYIHFLFS